MATERSTKRPVLLWVGLGACLLVVLVCVCGLAALITKCTRVSGTVTITDVILTTGIDAQGNPVDNVTQFDPTVDRICCVVTLSAPKPVHIGTRWYHEDTLVYEQAITEDHIGHWCIERIGATFPEGHYRVEVYLVERPERIVYFTVGQ